MSVVFSFHNIYFQGLVYYYKPTHGKSLLNSVNLLLNDLRHNVRDVCKDPNFHHNVFNIQSVVDAVLLFKRVVIQGTRGHLCLFAIQVGQCYEILSKAKTEKERDSDDCESSEAKEDNGKNKAVFHVGSFLFPILET